LDERRDDVRCWNDEHGSSLTVRHVELNAVAEHREIDELRVRELDRFLVADEDGSLRGEDEEAVVGRDTLWPR
jgi:hypothetical protein